MIGTVIKKVLTENAAVSALIGSAVYPVRVPQSKPFPAVTYQIISTTPSRCKGGVSKSDKIRVQLNIFSEKYEQMEAVAAAVREVLDGLKDTVLGIEFRATYESETDLHEDAAKVYHKATDYTFTVNR